MTIKKNEVGGDLNRQRDELMARSEVIFAKDDAGLATPQDEIELGRILASFELLLSNEKEMIKRLKMLLGQE